MCCYCWVEELDEVGEIQFLAVCWFHGRVEEESGADDEYRPPYVSDEKVYQLTESDEYP